jgi:hypothetical protein
MLVTGGPPVRGGGGMPQRIITRSRSSQRCAPRGPVRTENLIRVPYRNRLSWRDDRAVLLCSGRPGLAIRVEVTA